MRKLDRYISTTVLTAMILVLLVIGGLDLLFTIIEELGDVDETYQAGSAMRFVLYTIPGHIYELLPMTMRTLVLGDFCLNRWTTFGITDAATFGNTPTATARPPLCPASLMLSIPCRSDAMLAAACCKKTSPNLVSIMPFLSRRKSLTPSASSSSRNVFESAGWVIASASAAAPTLRNWAMVRKH